MRTLGKKRNKRKTQNMKHRKTVHKMTGGGRKKPLNLHLKS